MEKEITDIETFLKQLHGDSPVSSKVEPPPTQPKKNDDTKIPLDMRLLQNRIDSVSLIKYYKDLKNDRIRIENNVKYMNDTDTLMTEIAEHETALPWKRADKYTRRRRITEFAKAFGRTQQYSATDIKKLSLQLLELFDTKRLALKDIALDEQGVNIVSILEYRISTND